MINNNIPGIFLAILIIYELGFGQPDPRFNPFDWINYRSIGKINSITEGFSYAYFGTEEGGILRYHLYGNRFDAPITKAQGLSDNCIKVVHFDRETGIIWVATAGTLEYSHTREGDWYRVSLDEIGIIPGTTIRRIGSSRDYLWAYTGTMFIKLNRVSGIVVGVMTSPDEENISWSSGPIDNYYELPQNLYNYTVAEGWLLNRDIFINPKGSYVNITTFYSGQFNDFWVGTDNGTIFLGDTQMEIFYPLLFGLANTDVTALSGGKKMWLAGRYGLAVNGITRFDPLRKDFTLFDFSENINMNPQSIYSILDIGDEVWFGSETGILIYNIKEAFWRSIDGTIGLPRGPIYSMVADSGTIWVGSAQGIARIDQSSKRAMPGELEELLRNKFIYDVELIDNQLWIGTAFGLFIYDKKTHTIFDFRQIGNLSQIDDRKDVLADFWEIEQYQDKVYIATPYAIITFVKELREWGIAAESAAYNSQRITAIVFSGNEMFIGTEKGLIRLSLKNRMKRVYNYPFLGRINDIIISQGSIWCGTTEGLIEFDWRVDS